MPLSESETVMDTQKNLDFLQRLCEQIDNSPNRLAELNALARAYPAFSSYYNNVHKMPVMTPEHWGQVSGLMPVIEKMRLSQEKNQAQAEQVDTLAEDVKALNAKFDRVIAMLEQQQATTEVEEDDTEETTPPKRKRKAKDAEPESPAAETDAEEDAHDEASEETED